MADSISFWLTRWYSACRASWLSNGGCSELTMTMPWDATEVPRVMSGLVSRTGRKSGVVCSIMSTSPFISAAVAVFPSGM
ncbi:hypothetical protein D9M69_612300 [compost metagenome]